MKKNILLSAFLALLIGITSCATTNETIEKKDKEVKPKTAKVQRVKNPVQKIKVGEKTDLFKYFEEIEYANDTNPKIPNYAYSWTCLDKKLPSDLVQRVSEEQAREELRYGIISKINSSSTVEGNALTNDYMKRSNIGQTSGIKSINLYHSKTNNDNREKVYKQFPDIKKAEENCACSVDVVFFTDAYSKTITVKSLTEAMQGE